MPDEELPALPHDIGAPEDYLPGTPLWVWVAIAIVSLSLIALIVYLIRRLSTKKAPPVAFGPDQYILAQQSLGELKEQITSLPIGRFAAAVSLIMRICLSHVLRDPALYETEEEMAVRLESLNRVPSSVRSFLLELSSAKYAPSQVDDQRALQFLEQASTVLSEIRQSQSSENPS
jgi:hypothetical protein